MSSIYEGFEWHSSVGVDDAISKRSGETVSRMANNELNLSGFQRAGNSLLVHKTKKALWKISKDGNFIETVFDTDVLDDCDI